MHNNKESNKQALNGKHDALIQVVAKEHEELNKKTKKSVYGKSYKGDLKYSDSFKTDKSNLNLDTKKATIKNMAVVKYIIDGLFPRGHFVLISGESEVGKTRSYLSLMSKEYHNHPHSQIEKNKKLLLITSENPMDEVLSPLICFLKSENFIEVMDPDQITPKEGNNIKEICLDYIANLRQAIRQHNVDIVHLDPLPRFLDWNNENATFLMDMLLRLSKDENILISGVRNDGKNQDIKDKQKPKGNASALTDTPRIIVRVMECGTDSILEKESESDDAIVMYHTKNSLGPKIGRLFCKEVEKSFNGINRLDVAWYRDIRQLSKDDVRIINTLCGANENKSIKARILACIKENKEGVSPKDIEKSLKISGASVRPNLKRLTESGKITKTPDGKYLINS